MRNFRLVETCSYVCARTMREENDDAQLKTKRIRLETFNCHGKTYQSDAITAFLDSFQLIWNASVSLSLIISPLRPRPATKVKSELINFDRFDQTDKRNGEIFKWILRKQRKRQRQRHFKSWCKAFAHVERFSVWTSMQINVYFPSFFVLTLKKHFWRSSKWKIIKLSNEKCRFIWITTKHRQVNVLDRYEIDACDETRTQRLSDAKLGNHFQASAWFFILLIVLSSKKKKCLFSRNSWFIAAISSTKPLNDSLYLLRIQMSLFSHCFFSGRWKFVYKIMSKRRKTKRRNNKRWLYRSFTVCWIFTFFSSFPFVNETTTT